MKRYVCIVIIVSSALMIRCDTSFKVAVMTLTQLDK